MKFKGISDTSFQPAVNAAPDDAAPAFPKEAEEFWREKTTAADAAMSVTGSRELNAAPDCPCGCEGCAETEHCGGPDCLIEEI